MNRRDFLKSGAMTLASMIVPKSKRVDTSELEKDVKFWQEQLEFEKDISKFWVQYAFSQSRTVKQIQEALHVRDDAPGLEIVAWAEHYYKHTHDILYQMSWKLGDAGYHPRNGRWADALDSLLDLISDKAQLEEDVAYWKDLANKPKWLWLGTDPATGQDIVQEISFFRALGGEDSYKVVREESV